MSFKSRVREIFGLTNAATWLSFFSSPTHSGESVTLETMLGHATAYACTRVQAQAVSVIPLHVYRREKDGSRTRLEDHPLAELLGGSVSAEMTSPEFFEVVTGWICLTGNAFAEIVRSGNRVVALNLLPSDLVQVFRTQEGELRYRFSDSGKTFEFTENEILHIKGFSLGGDLGLNPIKYGANTIGHAIGGERTSGQFLKSGLMPSGFIEVDPTIIEELSDTQKKDITANLAEFSGSSGAGKITSLPPGITFKPASLDPETYALLASRRFSVEQICTFMGVPPVVIGHAAEGVTTWGSGIESILIQWIATGINPLLVKIERRIQKQLIGPGDRGIFVEFNREAFLQSDSDAKIKFLSTAVQNGLMSRNEGRRKLGLPDDPSPGSDELTVQVNLSPLGKLGQAQDARAAMRNALGMDEEQ